MNTKKCAKNKSVFKRLKVSEKNCIQSDYSFEKFLQSRGNKRLDLIETTSDIKVK